MYRGKLILYGTGDFINDYEGIGGHEEYRTDLALMYLPEIDPKTGGLVSLRMVPFRMRKFRLDSASSGDTARLEERLGREGGKLGTGIRRVGGVEGRTESLLLEW